MVRLVSSFRLFDGSNKVLLGGALTVTPVPSYYIDCEKEVHRKQMEALTIARAHALTIIGVSLNRSPSGKT